MTKKKVNIRPASEIRMATEKEIDQWVKTGSASVSDNVDDKNGQSVNKNYEEVDKEELYRLSLDIPKILHRRIKKSCASEGVSMKKFLTELLIKSFPEK